MSIPHIQYLRNDLKHMHVDKFFYYFSELADKYAVCGAIFLAYNILDLPKTFVCALSIVTAHGLSCILKSVNHEARPFFVADIIPNKCRFEHGNPSGHAYVSIALYMTMWDLVCRQYRVGSFLKMLSFSFLFVFLVVMGFSRIYGGVHTYN